MARNEFDDYRESYVETVERSIQFSGLPHRFFQKSKARMLNDIVAEYLPDLDSRALLDVGCGIGSLHPFIQTLFMSINGIDISAESIDRAKIDNPGASYLHYDGVCLPHSDRSFDMSLAVCVMHHVRPVEWSRFLSEMRRVVRPSGLVCLIEHNPWNPGTQLSVARCAFDKDAVLIASRTMRKRLRDVGLRDVRTRHFIVFPTHMSLARAIERSIDWIPLGAQYIATGIV